ncbi:hypothetical protein [Pseudoclavibacter soli]|uniref:hypothetical protein n=1 Tax=Pseudoclavibacter soli TaxID=452623 RepID=UPI0012EB69D6|nr:hypothetical protein [Pseudoclavibacter soli]
MYSLTELTGRKRNEDRTIVIATFEASKKAWVSGLVGAAGGTLLLIPLMLISPAIPVLGAVFGAIAAVWLVTHRTRTGLQQPLYRKILDRKAAKQLHGQLLMCMRPVRTGAGLSHVIKSSRPVVRAECTHTEKA